MYDYIWYDNEVATLMNKAYDVVIEKDVDGFYVANVPEIPGDENIKNI